MQNFVQQDYFVSMHTQASRWLVHVLFCAWYCVWVIFVVWVILRWSCVIEGTLKSRNCWTTELLCGNGSELVVKVQLLGFPVCSAPWHLRRCGDAGLLNILGSLKWSPLTPVAVCFYQVRSSWLCPDARVWHLADLKDVICPLRAHQPVPVRACGLLPAFPAAPGCAGTHEGCFCWTKGTPPPTLPCFLSSLYEDLLCCSSRHYLSSPESP